MREVLKLFVGAVLVLTVFSLVSTANALTEKEQWEKDYGDAYRLQPLNPPVILEHGGPDGGGYYYIDSYDPALNAPDFDWTDISSIGIAVPLTDDSNAGPFPIGFDFTFYGVTYNQFYICSNGWVSFTSTSTTFSNVAIPNSNQPNALLAIFWDDLNPANGGQVYYYSDPGTSTLIVSYDGVPHYSNYGSLFFQMVLDGSDSSIVYHYGRMDDGGHGNNGATVGIENADGTIGTQYRYNAPGIVDSMAVYFGFEPPIFGDHEVSPTGFVDLPNLGEVGDDVTPEVTFINQGTNTETFPVRVVVNYDGNPIYNETEQVTNLAPGGSVDITFPVFTSTQAGVHEFVATSELVGDENPANDTIRANYTTFGSIYYEDFELGGGYFVGDGDWQWGSPSSGPNGAHSGSNLWATNLAGNYNNNMLAFLVSPPFSLSDNAVLAYWQWFDTELNFDGGNVKISIDDGVTWNIITPAGGYDGVGNTANPLSGQEIFTGHDNDFWQYETFDLSAYAGSAALFRFDFGSDASVTYPGFYIDDFTIYGGGGAEPGFIDGIVTELSSGNPIEGAEVVAGNSMDVTNSSGYYLLEVIPGTYDVTATAEFHNPVTVEDVVVIEGQTTTVDIALPTPLINVNTATINLQVDSGEVVTVTRNVANVGDGELEFNVEIAIGDFLLSANRNEGERIANTPDPVGATDVAPYSFNGGNHPVITDYRDSLFVYMVEDQTGDNGCLGVEFDGTYFWVTGRNASGGDIHKLHKFDRDGNLIASYDQGTFSTWGWRDLAWDGEFLYASDENELAVIDPAIGQKIGTLPMPSGLSPVRALAWDPVTDHFWSANFSSNIYEFDRTGAIINQYANTKAVYGMAWDDVSEGGPYIWVNSQDGSPLIQISQFDPSTGTYTGETWQGSLPSGHTAALAGGACFTTEWDPSVGALVVLGQGTPTDFIYGYEIAPFSQWLAVDPMSGILQPAENIDLDITVDFTVEGLNYDSTYEAILYIHNNTPLTPEIPVVINGTVGTEDEIEGLPTAFALAQNFPNPFNATTIINFALPQQSEVKIEVYNILGQKTATLSEGMLPAGNHAVTWDASNVASGVYYYRLTAGDYSAVRMMTLLK